MAKCPNCGVEVEEGAKFCGECGAPIPQVKECPQCHTKWPFKAKFCGDCGYNFATGSMSAAGAALMGSGNTIVGDIVNNVNVSNSGNVSNVVSNTVVTNVVNNVATKTDGEEKTVGSNDDLITCELEIKGTLLCIGRKKFSSLKDVAKMCVAERKKYREPSACPESLYAFGACGSDVFITARWEESGMQKRFEDEVHDYTCESVKTVSLGEAFADFSDGEFGLFVSKGVDMRLHATFTVSKTFNPSLLSLGYQAFSSLDDNLFVVRQMTYDGVAIDFKIRKRSDGDEEKFDKMIDSWVEGKASMYDYNLFSDEECRLLKLKIDSTLLGIGHRDFDSAVEMHALIDNEVSESLKNMANYPVHADFLQSEGAQMLVEDVMSGEIVVKEIIDPLYVVAEEYPNVSSEMTSESTSPIHHSMVFNIFDRDDDVPTGKGRITYFEGLKGCAEDFFFCFGAFSLSRVELFCRATAISIRQVSPSGAVNVYARTVLDSFNYTTPSCGKCDALICDGDDFTASVPLCDDASVLKRNGGVAVEKRLILVEEKDKSFTIEL